MTTTDRRSKLASEISEHKVTYDNLNLEAFKAWDSKDWDRMITCGQNLKYLSETIKAKMAEINRLTHIEDQEKVQELL
jgi:hypothetical protein